MADFLAKIAAYRDRRLIRPDTLSSHVLRDIGLAEDVRPNALLGHVWLRR